MLRKLMYLFFIIFFALASFAAYTVIATVNKVDRAVTEPLGDMFRQLIVPATPVILPSNTTIVREINNLARLETASIEMEKVVTAERGDTNLLWGVMSENLIFVAHGKVVAGVDFAEMTPDNVQVIDPQTVMVYLPPAKIFDDLPALNNEKSYVAHRSTGLLAGADAQMETEVRRVAEARLREEALATGLLPTANLNAQNYMRSFLEGLGFTQVIFTDTIPPTPMPYTQEVPKGYVLVTPTPGP